MTAPHPLTPADLTRQQTPGQLAVSGDTVIYTLRRIVDGAERTELWTVPRGGGEPRVLAGGPGWVGSPRIDAAGERVAFLRSIYDASALPHIIALSGGESRPVAEFPRGAYDLAWDPDGNSLIVLAEDERSERVVPGPAGQSPTAIALRTVDWRADGEPGLRVHPRHLHRVPVDGTAPTRLTSGAWSASRPRVDGAGRVYFLADRGPDADLWPTPQVHRIGAAGIEQVTAFAGGVRRFHLADGEIRALAWEMPFPRDAEPPRWYRLPPGGAPVGYGGPLGSGAYYTGLLGDETDLHDWAADLDDCAEATTLSRAGATVPVRVPDGSPLLSGPAICGAIAADVAVLALPGAPGPDLYALGPVGPRRLTRHGSWLTGAPAARCGSVDLPGPAGPITVLLIEPPDGIACRATILDLHGGPTGQWGVVPPLEALLLAGAGFRVALPNIRGSIDRGPDWVAALGGAWGEADVADVLAVVDGLLSRQLAAPDRIGVMGLSYGGFLTQYLIGVTDQFAAAVAENGVSNQVAVWAGSDLGPSYNRAAGLGDTVTPDGVQRLWQASPLRQVAAIRTPLLMLQGEADRTCPASDNEQLFVALRALGRRVDYVLYPEESHLMQATGRIDRRIDRHSRVLAWFEEYLG